MVIFHSYVSLPEGTFLRNKQHMTSLLWTRCGLGHSDRENLHVERPVVLDLSFESLDRKKSEFWAGCALVQFQLFSSWIESQLDMIELQLDYMIPKTFNSRFKLFQTMRTAGIEVGIRPPSYSKRHQCTCGNGAVSHWGN